MAPTEEQRNDLYSARRWRVHVGLIVSGMLALLTVVVVRGVLLHVVAGVVFAGLVGVHVAQRRRTVRNLAGGLARLDGWRTSRGRLAMSDGVLAFLGANVLVSGIADWIDGRSLMLPVRALTGIPIPALNWHTSTSLAFVIYLVVHVVRRRGRLRHSRIR
jgi:hypothetical protein